MMWLIRLALVLCLTPALAGASWLKYDVGSLNIEGVFPTEAGATQEGFGRIEISDPIVWPVPVTPSTCAIGRLQWSRLSPGPALPLIFRTELKIFSCAQVGSAADVDLVKLRRITEATATLKGALPSDALIFIALLQAFCSNTSTSPGNTGTCTSIRANNGTIAGQIGSLTDGLAWQSTVISIWNDAAAAKTNFGF
jgi:hypothetical protein